MGQNGKITFSLRRKEIPVTLEDVDASPKQCVLRELSGADRDRFLNILQDKMKFGSDGKPGASRNFTGLHAELIHLSLYDEEGNRTPQMVIQGWPASVQTELFKMAQELSSLGLTPEQDKEQEELAKNA